MAHLNLQATHMTSGLTDNCPDSPELALAVYDTWSTVLSEIDLEACFKTLAKTDGLDVSPKHAAPSSSL